MGDLGVGGCLEREVGHHRIEIAIVMKQDQSFHDAEGGDDDIDCFWHGHPGFSKESIVSGTLEGDIVSADLAKWKSAEEVPGCLEIPIGSKTLKHFRENQIPNDHGNTRKVLVKQVCLPCGQAVEIFDPHGRVDQNH